MRRIITLGREFGSGGRELGRRIAQELNIAYYDHEIVQEIARRTSFTEQYIRQIDEKAEIPLMPITTAHTFSMQFYPMEDAGLTVFKEQSRIIREMAEKSDCVIVGRCGDYILRDMDPFRLFVYADMPFKIKRCRGRGSDLDKLSEKEVRQKILSIDKKRSRYYRMYTDQEWGDMSNYDLCVNTTDRDLKELAKAVIGFMG